MRRDSMDCLLCKAEHLTKWYYEDELIYICDCKTCHIPMVVLKRHGMDVTDAEMVHMRRKACEVFGDCITFRTGQRQIKDHLHWHIII